MQRDGVLQGGEHGNQEFCSLARRRTRRKIAWVRAAPEASRDRLPKQLRTALDRRHWDRRQENQSRWTAAGCLLLLRGRCSRFASIDCSSNRLPVFGE